MQTIKTILLLLTLITANRETEKTEGSGDNNNYVTMHLR